MAKTTITCEATFVVDTDVRNKLGSGGFGWVFPATWKEIKEGTNANTEKEKVVAAKRLQLEGQKAEEGKKEMDTIDKLWLDLRWKRHRNIVELFHRTCTKEEGKEYFWLFMELCEYGTLYDFFEGVYDKKKSDLQARVFGVPKLNVQVRIMADMAQGISFLHDNGIVHKDINPSNVLIAQKDPDLSNRLGFVAKLADFSVSSKRLVTTVPIQRKSHKPIELLELPEGKEKFEYDGKADIFSAGVTFFSILRAGGKINKDPNSELLGKPTRDEDEAVARTLKKRPEAVRDALKPDEGTIEEDEKKNLKTLIIASASLESKDRPNARMIKYLLEILFKEVG